MTGDSFCQEMADNYVGLLWTAESCRKHRKSVEDGGSWCGTTEDNVGQQGTVGDGGGRHNVVDPGPWLLLVGQVQKKTGCDDEI